MVSLGIALVEQFDKKIGAYWLLPNFANNIKAYKEKTVILEGYLLFARF